MKCKLKQGWFGRCVSDCEAHGAVVVLLAGLVLLPVVAAGCRREVPPGCRSCAEAKRVNGWCDACAVGYVAGLPIKSELLYETMDAHGHTLPIETMPCRTCRAFARSGGYCEASRIGWVRGQAYFSRLTYELARGTYLDDAAIDCDVCRENARSAGWCDACRRGMVGHVAIASRADFDAARREFACLLKAIEASKRCDYCAMAIVTDTRCFKCKKAYKGGVAIADGTSKPANGLQR